MSCGLTRDLGALAKTTESESRETERDEDDTDGLRHGGEASARR